MSAVNIYLFTIIGMLLLYTFRKKMNFITYELLVATIYLIALSYVQVLDVLLVIYLLFAIIPYIKYFKFNSFVQLLFALYFGTVLLFSCILHGISSAVSVFVIRYIGIIFFAFFFINYIHKCITNEETTIDFYSLKDTLKLIKWFAVCEIILTCIAFAVSGGGRLMLNYQCTVGNISIAGILLCGYCFYISDNRKNGLIFFYALFFTSIAILSGTRGYLIICIAMLMLYAILYGKKIVKFLVFMIFSMVLVLNYNTVFEKTVEITRLGESTGRRKSEDLLVWNYMFDNPSNSLFGLGFGKPVSELYNISSLISKVSNSPYTTYILYRVNAFHNLYTTTYYSAGLIGIILLGTIFLKIINYCKIYLIDKKIYYTSLTFVLLYMFVLWFRWSATSGILEFATFSFVLLNSYAFESKMRGSVNDNEYFKKRVK